MISQRIEKIRLKKSRANRKSKKKYATQNSKSISSNDDNLTNEIINQDALIASDINDETAEEEDYDEDDDDDDDDNEGTNNPFQISKSVST